MSLDEMKEFQERFSNSLEQILELEDGLQLRALKSFAIDVSQHLEDFKEVKEMLLYCIEGATEGCVKVEKDV